MSTYNIFALRNKKKIISHNLDTLLVLRKMGQVGQVGQGILAGLVLD